MRLMILYCVAERVHTKVLLSMRDYPSFLWLPQGNSWPWFLPPGRSCLLEQGSREPACTFSTKINGECVLKCSFVCTDAIIVVLLKY